jgi:hypothetical protein
VDKRLFDRKSGKIPVNPKTNRLMPEPLVQKKVSTP